MRLRLFLSFALVVLIAIISVVLVVRQSTAQEVRNFMFRGGVMGLENLVTNLETCYEKYQSWENCTQMLNAVGAQNNAPEWVNGTKTGKGAETEKGPSNPMLQILDADGKVIAGTKGTTSNGQQNETAIEHAIPLIYQGQEVGYLLPSGHMAFTSQQELSLVSQLNKAALTAAGIAGGVALILATLLAYSLLRPIQTLTQAVNQMGTGDLSQRVKISGDTEIATLGRVFNQMANSLEDTEERRKALTADIAHELRTPLSVQQAYLEALQDGIYELSLENLTPIAEQNRSLIRLVEDLRTLALADAGELSLERAETNFPALVRRVATRFEPQAKINGNTFDLSLAEDCPTLEIDPQRIEQILNNLLDNALRHSPEGQVIELNIVYDAQNVSLAIHDKGSGIPAEEIAYIFDRFYKSDKSRIRSNGGTGLGLSISRKLAEAHGGDLEAGNHPQGGAIFTLILPVEV
ncbi:MAG: ATP-binding protein [Chloroflexota bacterium]|nr:ATP-binding protein [Chloroflexota bacterium]